MRKIAVFVFVLIVLLLAVSCKQEIDCKLNIPSWAHGKWDVTGTFTVTGEGSLTIQGTYYVTSDNLYGTVTYVEAGSTSVFDLKSDLDGHKDYIVDFSQSSSSSEYTLSYTAKVDGDKAKQTLRFVKDGSNISYSEFLYINGLTYARIQGTLSPL